MSALQQQLIQANIDKQNEINQKINEINAKIAEGNQKVAEKQLEVDAANQKIADLNQQVSSLQDKLNQNDSQALRDVQNTRQKSDKAVSETE